MDTETGSRIIKKNLRKILGKNISNLITRRNMKDSNFTTFNFLTDKKGDHLDMFSALMMNIIFEQVNNTNVDTINQSSHGNRTVELKKQVLNSTSFRHNISDTTIFGLRIGLRNRGLSLSGPSDQIITEKDIVTRSRATGVRTTTPISVSV